MDSRIEGTGPMGSTSSESRAEGSARLDRMGRRLVVLGGIATGLLIILPALGVALLFFIIGTAGFRCDSGCAVQSQMSGVAAVALAVAVAFTVWRMVRGGTVALVLGSIGGVIVGAWGVLRLAPEYQNGQAPGGVFAVFLVVVGLAGFALALGAAFRLIARRRDPSLRHAQASRQRRFRSSRHRDNLHER